MSNINLLESAQGNRHYGQENLWGRKALLIPIIALILAFAALGAAKYAASYLSKEKIRVDKENKNELANLSGKNVNRIIDIDARISVVDEEASEKQNYNEVLEELERLIVTGARVSVFKYSPEKVYIEIIADNFKTVARQALNFKNSKYFSNLNAKQASLDEDNSIKAIFEK